MLAMNQQKDFRVFSFYHVGQYFDRTLKKNIKSSKNENSSKLQTNHMVLFRIPITIFW
jgi:hypothetical protein